jgi:putative colanic acid biosynthesis acetyltransferase WcaF
MFLSNRRKQSSHVRIIAATKKQTLCQCLSRCWAGLMQLEGYTTGAFERGAPKWKEALWVLVKCVFFQTPWPWPSALRVALLRAFGATIGKDVTIRSQVNVTFPWRLTVGDHVWFGEEVVVLSLAPVTQRAFLCTGSHDFRSQMFELIVKPITVRERSWIAAQVFIAPGVEIGAGSMVAAGSIVSENVPPKSLVRGNPAEVVKKFE